jgi:hypothetical protein
MDDWKRKAMGYRQMLEVFRGCIEIETIPTIGSPCHKKVIELLEGKQTQPLTVCPSCGGPADNGFDRCLPPNPYYCSKCENK